MIAPPIPDDEAERLKALRSTGLLDSPPEERLDRFTRLARRLLGVPIALVSLVDEDRQWFKSRVGLDATETSREVSFCGHAILRSDVMMVPDATLDPRFHDNPLVLEAPTIRFYASYPLRGPGGFHLGTLCVIDREPRTPTADEIELLRDLGSMVEAEIGALTLATTDQLTGISNRRGFEVLAGKAIARYRRTGDAPTLLFFDLDRFKEINDRHGHAAGDRALQLFATALVETCRDSDVVARLGGDEFCALLVDADDDACAHVESRLRACLAARQPAGVVPPVAFSVGAVRFSGEEVTLEDLLAQADRRMYLDKQRRRQVEELRP